MTTATLGTCNGCGLGLNLPHRAPWHPGQRVVVMTEPELDQILRASAPPRATQNSDLQNFRGPLAAWREPIPSSPINHSPIPT